MWEDNRGKRILVNILLVLLILIVVGALGYFSLKVRAENRAHDEELSEIYIQQQQQQVALSLRAQGLP